MFLIKFIFSFKIWHRKAIALIYFGIVALLSLLPMYDLPEVSLFPGAEKMVHFSMYFGMAVLACWSLDLSSNRIRKMYWLLLGVFMYGVLMEILQRTMHNGRSFEFRDMIANLAGAVAGLLVYRYLDSLRSKLVTKNNN